MVYSRYRREIWHKAFVSMTRGVNTREVLIKSLALAVFSTLFAAPYFHYLICEISLGGRFPESVYFSAFLFTQLFILFILCLLSAMVGFSFSKRYELPGFGDRGRFIRAAPSLFLLGSAMTALSYFLFDRFFFEISPVSYPKDALYLVSFTLKGALTDEVILRFCLVTIGVGILQHKGAGVVLAAVVASLFPIKYYHFIGISPAVNYLFITQFLLSLAVNLFLGHLFVSRGLFYAMAFKFFFALKYVVVVLTMEKSRGVFETLLTNPIGFS